MSVQMKKMVSSTEIKLDGNVFHEIFRYRPHHISYMSPKHVQSVDLCDGEWGNVGSVICWNFTTHDGKKKASKNIIEAIDEAKKSITFRVTEGDIKAVYKSFAFTVQVDKVGDNNLVTWTLEYEKQDENTPEPDGLMKLCFILTKDIEAYNLKN
ncbi:OLC1v1007996C1 [Oldenlandia corymbosa var. corymbosa]|uniref:OLC1v1007996C1 n=1 Tax=Oldenlandia corymbosa var. corymbosa TaxID=529605 RepID=A0AAV1DKI6_OLDCO|nr:OLC1v1007996C1 [Oldenlandia corymbosa var. corymbosa]